MKAREQQATASIISTQCRINHTDDGARLIAIKHIHEKLKEMLKCWPKEKNVKFEIKLILHIPEPPKQD